MTITTSAAGMQLRSINGGTGVDFNAHRRGITVTSEGSATTRANPYTHLRNVGSTWVEILSPQVMHFINCSIVLGSNVFWDDTNWTLIFDAGHSIQFYGCNATSGVNQSGVRQFGATYRFQGINSGFNPIYIWHNNATLTWHRTRFIWADQTSTTQTATTDTAASDRPILGSLNSASNIDVLFRTPEPGNRTGLYLAIPSTPTAGIRIEQFNMLSRPYQTHQATVQERLIGDGLGGTPAAEAKARTRKFFASTGGSGTAAIVRTLAGYDPVLGTGGNSWIYTDTSPTADPSIITITNGIAADDVHRIGTGNSTITPSTLRLHHQRTFRFQVRDPSLTAISGAAVYLRNAGRSFTNANPPVASAITVTRTQTTDSDGYADAAVDTYIQHRSRPYTSMEGTGTYEAGTTYDLRHNILVKARALGFYSEQATISATGGSVNLIPFAMRVDALDTAQATQSQVAITASAITLTANTTLDVLYRELKRWGRTNIASDEGFSRTGNELHIGNRTITGMQFLRTGTTLTQIRSGVNLTIPATLNNILVPILSPNLVTARLTISGGTSRTTFLLNTATSPNTVLATLTSAATQTATLNALTHPNILIKSRRINWTEWLSGTVTISSGGTFPFTIISSEKVDSDGNSLVQGFTAAPTRVTYSGATNRISIQGAGAMTTGYTPITAGTIYATLESLSLAAAAAPYEKPASFDGDRNLTLLHSYQLYNSSGTATTAIVEGFFKQRNGHGVADESNGEIEYRLPAATEGIENTVDIIRTEIAQVVNMLEPIPTDTTNYRLRARALTEAPTSSGQQGAGLTANQATALDALYANRSIMAALNAMIAGNRYTADALINAPSSSGTGNGLTPTDRDLLNRIHDIVQRINPYSR